MPGSPVLGLREGTLVEDVPGPEPEKDVLDPWARLFTDAEARRACVSRTTRIRRGGPWLCSRSVLPIAPRTPGCGPVEPAPGGPAALRASEMLVSLEGCFLCSKWPSVSHFSVSKAAYECTFGMRLFWRTCHLESRAAHTATPPPAWGGALPEASDQERMLFSLAEAEALPSLWALTPSAPGSDGFW